MSTSLRIVSAIKAGGVYFVAVFLFGFVLGTARTLIVLPRLGETVGVQPLVWFWRAAAAVLYLSSVRTAAQSAAADP